MVMERQRQVYFRKTVSKILIFALLIVAGFSFNYSTQYIDMPANSSMVISKQMDFGYIPIWQSSNRNAISHQDEMVSKNNSSKVIRNRLLDAIARIIALSFSTFATLLMLGVHNISPTIFTKAVIDYIHDRDGGK